MSLLGKVFVGIIFFLSIVFFTFAVLINATHIDHKTLAADYDAEFRDSQERNTQLQELQESYEEELRIEKSSRREALAALQTQYEAATFNFNQLEAQASGLRQELITATQANGASQEDLKAAGEKNRQLRDAMAQAKQTRDQLFDQLIEAKDEFNRLQGTHQSLSERAASMGL